MSPKFSKNYLKFIGKYDSDAVCYTDDEREETISISRIKDLGRQQETQKEALDRLNESVEKYIAVL